MSRETDIEADASRVELVPRVVTGLPSSDSEASIALIEACGLPEIGWRLTDFGVRLVEDLPVPFRLDERTISIRTNEVRDVVSAAMILREAIELSSLPYRTRPGASRVSALVTAAIYAGTVLLPRTQSLRAEAPLTLRVEDVLESPRGVIDTVLSVIRGRGEHLEPLDEENLRAAIAALPLSIPTEVLLTLGGDHRQTVDWERGVNSYGVSPRPTPWQSAFGSCTASSPTPRGFAAAHDLRHRLLVAALHGRLLETAEAASDEIRDNILRSLGIDPSEHTGVDVVLTPSGTDAELVVLTVSMAVTSQLTSIVVAPEEIGSGSLPAANGRHFSTTLPTGGVAEPGRAFDESVDGRVSVIEIPVRDTDGELLAVEDVEDLIEKALAVAPDRVLLHVVEGSKTGIRAPRSETVAAWQARFGDRMDVVVDAAQMRVDQTAVVDHLAQGRMVIITGSKFFGGPPFSGAVLIPQRFRPRITSSDAVLRGLGAYLSRTDVPRDLSTLRTVAHETPSYALLCRWAAALAEMRSFHNASPEIRDEVLRKLAAGISPIIRGHRPMQIPDTTPGPHAAEKQDGRTIIPRGRLWLVLCLGILILAQFWPVLAAPVQGDDRYWYAESAGITRGSYGHILSRTAKDVPYFLDRGRFAPVAFGARRMIALATVQLAVASSVPIVAIQALFKLLFGAAAALAVYAFISTARFRGSSRTISNLSPSSIRWVMIGFVGLLVSGAQAHFPFRNGWLAYFPLTYGAVVAIFGSLAFAQWCVKALDNPTRSLRASAYCGMILLAVLLNSTYELYYPAAVLAPIAILRQPTRLDITHERRAKLSLTATFLIPFTVVFSILRLLIRRTCAQSECYEGVIPELGPQVLSVAWRNLTSAIPGFGEAQLRSELAQVGIPWPDAFLIDFAWIGCLVGISIALAWRHQWQALGTAALDAEEAGALWQLAGIAAVAGIGPAVVMSLSKASHQAISDFGLPYRNVVVTWAALSLCTMLAIRAISVGRGHRWKTIVSIILAVAIGFLAAYTFPRNLAAIRANRMLPAVQSIEGIHWELVLGDTSEEADRRRCDLYADAEERIFTSWIQTRMKTGVQSSFEYFHKAPFCSRWDATS